MYIFPYIIIWLNAVVKNIKARAPRRARFCKIVLFRFEIIFFHSIENRQKLAGNGIFTYDKPKHYRSFPLDMRNILIKNNAVFTLKHLKNRNISFDFVIFNYFIDFILKFL